MLNSLKKWFQGVEVSEVSFILPFVQVTLKPSESDQYTQVRQSQSKTTTPQRQEIKLSLIRSAVDNLVHDGLLTVDYAYRTPTFIEKVPQHNLEIPIYKSGWNSLEGEIELFSGDLVWIVARFSNIAGRVLYKLPINMGYLPFLKGLRGVVTSRVQKHFEWTPDVCTGITLSSLNNNESVYFHCICHLPNVTQASRSLGFEAWNGSDKKDYPQNYNKKEWLERREKHHRDMIESSIGTQFGANHFDATIKAT